MRRSVSTCSVAIIEDHVLQRRRTEEVLARTGEFRIVFSGESLPEFVAWLRTSPPRRRPQLLILDLMVEHQPSVDPAVVEALLKAGLKIVVLTALSSPPLVQRIVRAGVTGIVGKRDSEEDVLAAVRAVLRGEEWMTSELARVVAGDPERPKLSVQEERALVLYATGLTVDQLAASMNISRDTAKQYLERVKKKYTAVGIPVRTKLDFGKIAWSEGLVDPTLSPSTPE